jgi:ATP phosphoribosyltransferase regulatory subunit
MRNWLLPENIQDILPPEARGVEILRARLLELFRVHGYQFVMPPMLEYVESLLTGTGEDLDLRTFKLVDQISGRMMGIRADITPQVARIDAHLLNKAGVARLCYCGSVLHTRARGHDSTREPVQIGAEIYGHAGIESDLEIQNLLVKALAACGRSDARIDIGHVGVFRSLCRHGNVEGELERQLHAALVAKDIPEVTALSAPLESRIGSALRMLPRLYGGREVLVDARRHLPDVPAIQAALLDLGQLVQGSGYPVTIDLADLRGYRYHSGVVFSAYVPGRASAVALGGRYDEVGKAFGRARPATGFSMDLMDFASTSGEARDGKGILCPLADDGELRNLVDRLRASGEVVIADLPGHGSTNDELGCDRRIVLDGEVWQVRAIK